MLYVDGVPSYSTIDYQKLYSGFVFTDGSQVDIRNTRIINATTTGNGAVLNASNSKSDSNWWMRWGELRNNHADGYGGAIYATNRAYAYLYDLRFVGNTAQQGGAIYYATNRSIGNNYLYFTENGAISDTVARGGAIYNASAGNIDFSTYCYFINNYAKGATAQGGAIYNTGNYLNIVLHPSGFTGNYII